ncbi:MAG: hypothetical protein HC899_24625 [Leptolyngbyaceae cyanobacterium SM1_4_3]|nr:hypothetical protein [Leptolyngbyaceae cyanobacterium SM1_4_3]
MRGNPVQRTGTSVQENPTSQTNVGAIDPVGAAVMITFPVLVICAIVGYRKYRTTVLQRRIKRLNRVWQIDSCQKLP